MTTVLTEWSYTLDPNPTAMAGGMPVVVAADAGLVLASDGGALYAVRLETGEPAWKAPAYTMMSGFTRQDGAVYVSDGELLRAVSLADGQTLWEYQGKGMTADYNSAPVATDRLVFVAEWTTGAVHAVRRNNGNELWVRRYSNSLSSALVANDNAVFYAGEGSIRSIDQLGGSLNWTWVPADIDPSDPSFRVARNHLALINESLIVTYQNNYSVDVLSGQLNMALVQGIYTEPDSLSTSMISDPSRRLIVIGNTFGHVFAMLVRYSETAVATYPSWLHIKDRPVTSFNTYLAFWSDNAVIAAFVHGDAPATDFVMLGVDRMYGAYNDMPVGHGFTMNQPLIAPFAQWNGMLFALTLSPDAIDPPPGQKPMPPAAELHAISYLTAV